jgi:tripartite-type tricarboxylate transporter receptor subunit TctC
MVLNAEQAADATNVSANSAKNFPYCQNRGPMPKMRLPAKYPRRLLIAAVILCGLQTLPAAAADQLKFVVGFTAGSGLDLITRIVTKRVQIATGTTATVENRPGAGGRIAAEAVARSDPDGATILVAPIVTTAFMPFIYKNLDFDPMTDLAPVTRIGNFKFAVGVNKDLPVSTLADFVAYVKAHPGKVGYGTPGVGTPAHFLGAMFNRATGTDLLHVPYRGSGAASTAMLGGEIQANINTTASLVEFYRNKQIKLLAVTGKTRSPELPDVPTFAELKMNLGDIEDAELWYGIFVAGKTPAPVVQKLNQTLVEALRDPEVRTALQGLDIEVVTDTPESFSKLVREDYERWGKVIKSTGFTLND